MSEAWAPDDRPEPDELELVYADLKLAQDEIERLKERCAKLKDCFDAKVEIVTRYQEQHELQMCW